MQTFTVALTRALSVFTYRQTFGAFWRFFVAVAIPVAGLIALLTVWAVSLTRNEVSGGPILWVVIGLLAIAWLTAVTVATWQRFDDAGAHPTLALAWPFLPFAWAGVFAWWPILHAFGVPTGSDAALRLAVVVSTFVTVALLVFVLVLCAQEYAFWAKRLNMVWIALVLNPVLSGVGLLVGWLIKRRFFDRHDGVREGTRLLLGIGLFAMLMAYIWTTLPANRDLEAGSPERVGFTATLILIGVFMTTVHVWRWVGQARYFPTAYITTKYRSGGLTETRTLDPRWYPRRAAVFKVFGLVWIWLTLFFINSYSESTTGLLFAGTILYWGLGIVAYFILGVPVLVLLSTLFMTVYPTPVEGGMRQSLLLLIFMVVWLVVSVAFGNKYNWTPSDRRTNYYHAFSEYLKHAPW